MSVMRQPPLDITARESQSGALGCRRYRTLPVLGNVRPPAPTADYTNDYKLTATGAQLRAASKLAERSRRGEFGCRRQQDVSPQSTEISVPDFYGSEGWGFESLQAR